MVYSNNAHIQYNNNVHIQYNNNVHIQYINNKHIQLLCAIQPNTKKKIETKNA